MFDKLPDTVAMSEAWALFYAHLQYTRGHIPEKEFPRLVRGLLRMQFKPMKSVSIVTKYDQEFYFKSVFNFFFPHRDHASAWL